MTRAFFTAYLSRFRYHLFGVQWRRVKILMHLQHRDAIAWSCNDTRTPSYHEQKTKGRWTDLFVFLLWCSCDLRVFFPLFWRASDHKLVMHIPCFIRYLRIESLPSLPTCCLYRMIRFIYLLSWCTPEACIHILFPFYAHLLGCPPWVLSLTVLSYPSFT